MFAYSTWLNSLKFILVFFFKYYKYLPNFVLSVYYFCLLHILVFSAYLYLKTYTLKCHYNFIVLFFVYMSDKYINFSAGLYLLTYTIRCHYEFVFPISRDADFSGSFKYLTFLNVVSLFYKQSKIDS